MKKLNVILVYNKKQDKILMCKREKEPYKGKFKHLMTFQYPLTNVELQVYTGKLNEEVKLIEEVNKLYWIDKNENFLDTYKFAGDGNIGHILLQTEIYKDKLFNEE